MKGRSPCETCIVLSMCMGRVRQHNQYGFTTDLPFLINNTIVAECYIVRDWLMSHPQQAWNYETSYMSELIGIMKLSKELGY